MWRLSGTCADAAMMIVPGPQSAPDVLLARSRAQINDQATDLFPRCSCAVMNIAFTAENEYSIGLGDTIAGVLRYDDR